MPCQPGEEGKWGDDDVFRGSVTRILIATDEGAGRGLDCPDCHTVVNVGPPGTATAYVHRGGRAGRFGREGEVCTVVGLAEEFVIGRIANEVGVDIKCVGRVKKSKKKKSS